MSIDSRGKIVAQAAYHGQEYPTSQSVIDLSTDDFRAQAIAGEIRAAAICYDVRTVPPGEFEKCDAICVSLEHECGESFDAYLPYRKIYRGKIEYGELFARPRDAQFFS